MNKLQDRLVFRRTGCDTSKTGELIKPTQREIDDWRGKKSFMFPQTNHRPILKDERKRFMVMERRLNDKNPSESVKAEFRCRICKRVFTEDPEYRRHQVSKNGKMVCPKMEESDEYDYR